MRGRHWFAAALAAGAVWAIALQFVFPLLFARREGVSASAFIRWDFWWAVHLALAWQLCRPGSMTRIFAVVVTWLEIAILGVRLALFLFSDVSTFWTVSLAWNRLALVLLFLALAFHLSFTREGRNLGPPE